MNLKLEPKLSVRLDLVKISVVGVAALGIVAAWVFFFGGLSTAVDSKAAGVTINSATAVSASSNPFSALSSGDTINVYGQFEINQDYTIHQSNSIHIIVDGTNAELKVFKNRSLRLGAGSSITLLNGGTLRSTGGCQSSAKIYFGSAEVANCPGTGGASSFVAITSAGGIGTSGAMLPVSWMSTSTDIRGEDILINWSTAMEENNSGFEVEFSENGTTWERVSSLKSKAEGGTTNDIQYYTAVHTPPAFAVYCMYRIKQIDFDGKYEYSKVMLVERELEQDVVIGTLGNSRISVKVKSDFGNNSKVLISDLSGKIVVSEEVTDKRNFTLPRPGVYIIEVSNGSKVDRIKHLVR